MVSHGGLGVHGGQRKRAKPRTCIFSVSSACSVRTVLTAHGLFGSFSGKCHPRVNVSPQNQIPYHPDPRCSILNFRGGWLWLRTIWGFNRWGWRAWDHSITHKCASHLSSSEEKTIQKGFSGSRGEGQGQERFWIPDASSIANPRDYVLRKDFTRRRGVAEEFRIMDLDDVPGAICD